MLCPSQQVGRGTKARATVARHCDRIPRLYDTSNDFLDHVFARVALLEHMGDIGCSWGVSSGFERGGELLYLLLLLGGGSPDAHRCSPLELPIITESGSSVAVDNFSKCS